MSARVKRFGRNMAGRDLIVGDIHGHFTKLMNTLDVIGFDPNKDRLFSVGDLVDRGPESTSAVLWVQLPWFHAVQGNHEDMAIRWPNGHMDAGNYAANGGAWNIGQTDEEQKEVALAMSELPLAIELETELGTVGIVHADCPCPSWQEFTQSIEHDKPSKREAEHLASMAIWSRHRIEREIDSGVAGVRAVVVGHTPQENHKMLGNVHYIDTAAWFGRPALRPFCILDAATLGPA